MRADRLISILLILQNRGRMTSKELAERLEVSERTIHRDMDALSMAGVPVYAERGSGGGWSLAEGYRTNLTGLKAEEIKSLLLAAPTSVLQDLGLGANFEDAFQKLIASTPDPLRKDAQYVRERIHIDGAGWHQSGESVPYLPTVQEAIWQERKLSISYRREDAVVKRIVLPLGLVAKRSIWYLVAQAEGELRTYRISRLEDAKVSPETFQRPADFDLADYWETSMAQFKSTLPRYPARIRAAAEILPRLRQERFLQIKTTQPEQNGWVVAEVQFETLDSACEIALGYGAQIQVLEPEELQTQIRQTAAAILALYKTAPVSAKK